MGKTSATKHRKKKKLVFGSETIYRADENGVLQPLKAQVIDEEYDETVDINFDKKTINVAVTKCGGISVREYDLHQDEKGNWYFNYGIMQDEIQINEFETIKD